MTAPKYKVKVMLVIIFNIKRISSKYIIFKLNW